MDRSLPRVHQDTKVDLIVVHLGLFRSNLKWVHRVHYGVRERKVSERIYLGPTWVYLQDRQLDFESPNNDRLLKEELRS